jgi:DNA-binding transcriptional MerR regulator
MTPKATARTRRTLRIGELARASGLTPDTLRYYERLGLLAAAQRTAGNFRAYDAATLDRLRFIKTAQSHGLSLREIGELLARSIREGADFGPIAS